MTRRGYLVAATLWFCAVGVAWSLFWMRRADDSARTRMQQALWGVATRLLAAPGVASSRTAPTVDPDRLMGHVRALAFERWTPADRARARGYLAHTLIELGHDPAQLAFAEGINLEVVRPGTDPTAGDVLLAAHYDSRHGSPGADDNATGVAVVLEAARLLRTPTPRGLRLVFFDAEERGLKGSLAYAQSPSRIKDLRAVVVLEMLGYACHTEGCQKHPEGLPLPAPTTGNFLAVVGDLEHIDLLRAFRGVERPAGGPGAVPIFALPVPGRGHALPDTRRSDHAPFWDQGIGAVMVTDTAELRNPHYHLPGDVPERLDGAFFTGAAQAVLDAVVHLTR